MDEYTTPVEQEGTEGTHSPDEAEQALTLCGERLRSLIEENQLLQNAAAQDLFISASTLSGYLHGKRHPDIPMLIRLSQYFHTSVDYLIGTTKRKNPYVDRLSADEDDLLYLYRRLGEDEKRLLRSDAGYLLRQKNFRLSENA